MTSGKASAKASAAQKRPADRGKPAPGPDQAPAESQRDLQRAAIETAALRLLDEGGPQAFTSRAVSAAAGVQAMTLYRLYGDMDGLMAQVVARCLEQYVETKTTRERSADPVDDLRAGWDLHVDFGLAHPHVYAQIYGQYAPDNPNPATHRAAEVLRGLVSRVARAGRLTCDIDTAAWTVHAAGCGTTLTLINTPPSQRDPALSHTCREAVLASLTTDREPSNHDGGVTRHAVALTALLGENPAFTEAERALLLEWLARLT